MPTILPDVIELEIVKKGKGSSKDSRNLLFLGDGFSDKNSFNACVLRFVWAMFHISPFHMLKDYIHIYQAFIPSPEPGVTVLPPVERDGSPAITGIGLDMPEIDTPLEVVYEYDAAIKQLNFGFKPYMPLQAHEVDLLAFKLALSTKNRTADQVFLNHAGSDRNHISDLTIEQTISALNQIMDDAQYPKAISADFSRNGTPSNILALLAQSQLTQRETRMINRHLLGYLYPEAITAYLDKTNLIKRLKHPFEGDDSNVPYCWFNPKPYAATDPTHKYFGKDFGLVCILVNDDFSCGINYPDYGYFLVSIGDRDKFNITIDNNVITGHTPQTLSPSVKKVLTFIHELGHSCELGDEYSFIGSIWQLISVPSAFDDLIARANIIYGKKIGEGIPKEDEDLSEEERYKSFPAWPTDDTGKWLTEPLYPNSPNCLTTPEAKQVMTAQHRPLKKNKPAMFNSSQEIYPEPNPLPNYPFPSQIIGLYEGATFPGFVYRPAGTCLMRNSEYEKAVAVELDSLPNGVVFYDEDYQLVYDDGLNKLTYIGAIMSEDTRDELKAQTNDGLFKAAIDELYRLTHQNDYNQESADVDLASLPSGIRYIGRKHYNIKHIVYMKKGYLIYSGEKMSDFNRDRFKLKSQDPTYNSAIDELYRLSNREDYNSVFFRDFCYVCKHAIVKAFVQDPIQRGQIHKLLAKEYPGYPEHKR
jgi:hypothetical protein